ncbi:MAG: triose-phosphate isomerase family protein [Acidimicrobiales bacterium]
MRYVLANWKMYPTIDQARAVLAAVQAGLAERLHPGSPLPRVIVCPPIVALAPLRALVDDRVIRLGAQNCHWEQCGPYTGEVSAAMLRGLVDYVMVGHSERRAAGETDEQIAAKVAAVAAAGLVPIVLVGEDDAAEDPRRATEERLRRALSRIDPAEWPFIVVYEPAWAIGAPEPAPPDHVRRAVHHLKAALAELGRPEPVVLYGGAVDEDDLDQFLALEDLDGVGATRATLDADSFLHIIERVAGHRDAPGRRDAGAASP